MNAGIEHAVMSDGALRLSRDVQHLQVRLKASTMPRAQANNEGKMRALKTSLAQGEYLLHESHGEVNKVAVRREVRRSVFGTVR